MEVAPGRRHIIRRPRLTRLLDESPARIILLVAPAGYGKTTLAQEWLGQGSRQVAWYRGSAASADVAALAVGLAEAAATVVAGAGQRMRELLRATNQPEQAVHVLAELLAEDLAEWPEDAWLAIDDYHFAMESEASEQFVDLLATQSPIRLLVASRRRPSWASARRILYGEVYEVGRNLLAMSQEEAQEVLSRRKGEEVPGLVALAEGWPAVIGLAALTEEFTLPEGDISEALYDYFAEELFQSATPDVQRGLCQLALAPIVTTELADFLFGPEVARLTLDEGKRLGFLSPDSKARLELHPLLRSFLERKLAEQRSDDTRPLVTNLGRFFLERGQWDDAFSLIERFPIADLLVAIVEAALPTMLMDGRLATLSRSLDYAEQHAIDSPILDLARAEVFLRQGLYSRSEAFALQAARRFEPEHAMSSRAFFVAGQGAHFADRSEAAIQHHKKALEFARSESDVRQALWGQFTSTIDVDPDRAAAILADLEKCQDDSPDSLLRAANANFMRRTRTGSMEGVLESLGSVAPLLERASDPMVRSSFLNSLGYALSLAGKFDEANAVADQEILEAKQFRLRFALSYAYAVKALAKLGVRHFTESGVLLDQAQEAATELQDVHLDMASAAIRARLCVSQGAFDEALSATERAWDRLPSQGMCAEYFASRALALACAGESGEALALAESAHSMTKGIEAATLIPCVRAIVALREGRRSALDSAIEALETAELRGDRESFVSAYRGYPDLLFVLAAEGPLREGLVEILLRAHDYTLANSAGLTLPQPQSEPRDYKLSKRERQVYELLGQGFSNREIAKALFISEATVKVHIRHIFEKLGVRSRTEAALRASFGARTTLPQRRASRSNGPEPQD